MGPNGIRSVIRIDAEAFHKALRNDGSIRTAVVSPTDGGTLKKNLGKESGGIRPAEDMKNRIGPRRLTEDRDS